MRFIFIMLFMSVYFNLNSSFSKPNNYNWICNPIVLNEVTVKGSMYPRFHYADSVINNSPVDRRSRAVRKKNPGNIIDPKTGRDRIFASTEDGYNALIHQLELYISGESQWTNENTTLREYVKIYAEAAHYSNIYLYHMCRRLNVTPNTKISTLNPHDLAKAHSEIECHKMYNLLYGDT